MPSPPLAEATPVPISITDSPSAAAVSRSTKLVVSNGGPIASTTRRGFDARLVAEVFRLFGAAEEPAPLFGKRARSSWLHR